MNVSLNWAQEYSNADISSVGIDEVVKKIGAQLGAVEEVTDWGARYEGSIVAKVISCVKHPNADKLSHCMIDDGGKTKNVDRDEKGLVQVVCGAPNVKAGQTVVWLSPGSTVPSTYGEKPFVLGARELRGIMSNGMIASASELGLSDGHGGILVLSDSIKAGTPFVELFGLKDYIIDCENKMFTHRPDCFGILGVSRELAGIQGKKFESPAWYLNEPVFDKVDDLPLTIDVKTNLVPRFSAVAVKNIKIGPSPVKIQADLSKVGIRPINNVVDITNWLMHFSAQPLHAYDYDKVATKNGGKANLTARLSKKGEKLALLNGKTIELKDDETVLICAGDTPIGVGGVMGGADTEVDENTKNIIIECATFDMYNIRRTSMKYGLFTDAVTRFNKGQSPLQNAKIIKEALEMTNDLAEGKQASGLIDVKVTSVKPLPDVVVTSDFINLRLGSQLSAKQMAKTLELVEFKVSVKGDELTVTVPFWRRDIKLPEDIVEEIGRLVGYDSLPVALPVRSAEPATKNQLIDFKDTLRDLLSSAGANEVLTYSFVHGELLNKVGQDSTLAYKLNNAISPDLQYYRLSLLPSLLDKVHSNIKAGYGEFAIYEIGKAHSKKLLEDGLPIEAHRLAFIFAADAKAAKNYQGEPYYQVRHYLARLLTKLGVLVDYLTFDEVSAKITSSEPVKLFYKERSAIVQTKEGEFIGTIGEFNSSVTKNLKLPEFCAGFEVDVKQLLAATSQASSYKQLPKFPKVTQDISLKIDANVSYKDLEKCVKDALRANQPAETKGDITPIDIYSKESVKHITFRLTIASYTRTLTAKEVNTLLDEIALAANKRLKATRL